jgi:hypothetical protein
MGGWGAGGGGAEFLGVLTSGNKRNRKYDVDCVTESNVFVARELLQNQVDWRSISLLCCVFFLSGLLNLSQLEFQSPNKLLYCIH